MKRKPEITNMFSDDSEAELQNKDASTYKPFSDNTIKCFLRIKPLDQKEKESNFHFKFFLFYF
jgi:hypothetical protein